MRFYLVIGWLITAATTFAQQATLAEERLKGLEKRKVLEANSLISGIPIESIGPTIMSGRVTDLAVNPDNPTEFYVSYASGGLWYTLNNGQSFNPIFDDEDVMTIGAIAVDWKSGIIYVGTGEVNASRSSYAGTGLYKSTNQGASWEWLGLPESHHIGSILIQPGNPDKIAVAVMGHLYSSNPERGVYVSTDGGKNWNKSLFINDMTGAVELVQQPGMPEVIYASMWTRERKAWHFTGQGSGSGLYKSTNFGETWQHISTAESGFPSGKDMGRAGIAVSYNTPGLLFAVVDNQQEKPDDTKKESGALTIQDFKNINKETFLAFPDSLLDSFLRAQGIPETYTATMLKENVRTGKWRPTVINEYLSLGDYAFDAPIHGCEVYRSDNDGQTWQKVNETDLYSMYYTYGYYFGKIYVAPYNDNELIILGVPIARSTDGGKTFADIGADHVHADHHVLWVNPNLPGHFINGNDGGVNITYDHGAHWIKANTPAVGQFYTVAVDEAQPYQVYGGLQDNGVWVGPSTYQFSQAWQQDGIYPYKFIMGGDGMQVQVDTRNNTTVYTGYQFGNYARLNLNTDDYLPIRPRHEMGEYPLRFNWQTPIWLSTHQQDILYYGSNKFHRSLNQGENVETLSNDLTIGAKAGNVPFATITSIHESPLQFGLLYVGTDDGKVHVSRDGGNTWTDISTGLPANLWVSRVTASAHDVNRVYVTLNGYRSDHFKPYIYMSNDQGKKWVPLGTDLPYEPVNVLKEDPKRDGLLFVGTDQGLYVSLNNGVNFMAMRGFGTQRLPRVAVHDLAIQNRDEELVIATHGRSLYKANIHEIRLLTDTLLSAPLHLFQPEKINHQSSQGMKPSWNTLSEPFLQKARLVVYAAKAGEGVLEITDQNGAVLSSPTYALQKGLNEIFYDLQVQNEAVEGKEGWALADNGHYYLLPGVYKIRMGQAGIYSQLVDLQVVERK